MPYSAGTFNPVALEPYPVETALASQLGSQSPATARTLLGQYALERNTNENLYTNQLQQQRDIANEGFRQQILDRMTKALVEGSDKPGVIPFMASSSQFAPFFAGASPEALQNFVSASQRHTGLADFKTAAGGAYEAAQAGLQVPTSTYQQMTGVPNLQQGAPLALQTTDLAGRYRVAAAQAGAAGRTGPHMMVPVPSGEVDENGKPQYTQVPVPLGASPEQVQAIVDAARRGMGTVTAGQPNVAGAPPDPRTQQPLRIGLVPNRISLPPANRQGDTNPATNPLLGPLPGAGLHGLPMAQTDTPANAPTGGAQAAPVVPQQTQGPSDTPMGKIEQWQTPSGQALQGRARQGLSTLPESARQSVLGVAGKIGGIVPIRIINGVPQYIGKDGNPVGPVP